jgi:anthranilate synthase component 1
VHNLDFYKVLKTGDIEAITGDPLIALEEELKNVKFVPVPGVPSFTGKYIYSLKS